MSADPARTVRVLIVDDEPLVRVALRDALSGDARFEVVGERGDGISALEACAELKPDVVLLDVQMPALTGVEVATQLGEAEHRPAIVFVTAYDAYAVRAFELDAIDYVLKPFDDLRVRAALERVAKRLPANAPANTRGDERDERIQAALTALARRVATPARFVASVGGRLRIIDAASIDWIEAADNYVRLHTATGSALIRETMKSVEARLDPEVFVRIHRSQIVRLSRIRELQPLESGDYSVLLTTGIKLTLSRTHRAHLMARLKSSAPGQL
jgi:two-component system LytT family response regulator